MVVYCNLMLKISTTLHTHDASDTPAYTLFKYQHLDQKPEMTQSILHLYSGLNIPAAGLI